ncbi:MAG: autotransporter-associated beta strand repeat-containing protein, partial [Verrucomicrobia bacterium]|nr:autotransporter-associated beta strand repeat-containing protein [Verrucomicrobiota bacterium]
MKTYSLLLGSLCAAALFLLARGANAQTTNDWIDGSTGLWSTTGNWTNAPDATGVYQTNVIQLYGSVPYFTTNDLSTTGEAVNTYLIHRLELNNGVDGVVLNGNALRFTNDPVNVVSAMLLQNGAGGIIISNAIDLGSDLILGGDGAGIVTNAGIIGNSISPFGLIKNGASKFVLAGANTFAGSLVINAGVINLRNDNATGSGSVSVTAAGAALELEGGIATQGAVALTLNGDGISSGGALRNISGANTYAGAITLGSASRINSDAGSLALSGSITGTGQALTVGGSGNTTISAGINTSTGGSLTKDGSGTLFISAAGNYTGATLISLGVVNAQNSSALGTSSGVTVSGSGAALQLQGGGVAIGSIPLSLTGTGVSADGALRNISGANSYAGAITLLSDSRINSDASTLTLTGGITGTGAILRIGGSGDTTIGTTGINTSAGGSLIKDGTGRLTLTAADNYTASTVVNAGALNIQNATAINNSSGVTVNGGGLELQGTLATITTPLTLSGDGATAGTGALRNISGNNNASGLVTLGSDARINSDAGTLTLFGSPISITNSGTQNLTVGGAGSILISNSIGLGTGTLTKDGAGTVTINGHNTSSGSVTVSNGTLRGNVYSGLGGGVVATVATNGFGTGAITLAGGTLSMNPVASVATNGLTGRYFTNGTAGAPTANNYGSAPILGAAPVDVRTYANLNFNDLLAVLPGAPTTNNYGIQFVGKLFITNAGPTTFLVATDDGHRMYIDGVLVNDRTGNGSSTNTVNLSAGLHDVRLDFGQGTGGNSVVLSYQLVGAAGFTVVPTTALFTSETGSNNVINLGNAVNLTAAMTSTIDLQGANFTAAGFNSLNPGASANLTVSGLAGKTLVFSNTTFSGGTDTLTATPNVSLGRLNDGGTAVTLSKLGSGRLILDQTAVANVMGGTSIFDIQAGSLVLNANVSTNGFNPAGGATIQLNGGNLIVDTKFGSVNLTNPLTVLQSATLSAIASGVTTTLSGTNTLSGGSVLTLDVQQPGAAGNATLTLAGPILGTGSLVKNGAGPLNLANSNNFVGSLTINLGTATVTADAGYTGATVVNNGALTVNGANGRLSGTSSVTLNNGTTLTIGANTDTTWLNRVKDVQPLTLNRATLILNGSLVAGVNRENIGADFIFGGGLNTITLAPATGDQVELATDALTRNNFSTLLVRGTGLGSNGNNTARFFVTNTPPATIGGGGATDSKTISIVPWVTGDTASGGSGTNFVTYSAASGIRPLNTSTEYDLTPMSGTSSSRNYNSAGEFFTNGSATVNSLRLTGGTVDLGGTNSTLTLGSGALMFTINATIQNGTVAFGANEAVIHLSHGAAVTGTLNTKLTGTGGLTVNSSGTASTLTLGGNNSGLSGVVTINGSTVNIANDFNLGVAPGAPTAGSLNLANGTLNVTADMALNANRGIAILPGGATLSAAAGNTLTYGGVIAGANTNTFAKAGAGTLLLTGANTYQGPTLLTAGRLAITNDNALGASPASVTNNFIFNGGTLAWNGPSDSLTNRGLVLSGAGTLDITSGSTLTDSVPLTGAGALTKAGAGTLLLSGINSNSGTVTINGGTLAVQGNSATMQSVTSFLINSNGVLTLGSTADTTANPNRLGDGGSVIGFFSGGELRLNGSDNAATTTEAVGTVTNFFGMGTITLTPAATRQVELSVTNALMRLAGGIGAATGANPVVLVRGVNLGGTGADSSRILFGGTPTTNNFGGGGAAGTTTISIIPWMVGDLSATGSGNSLVTYDVNGLRPLAAGEYESGSINNATTGGVPSSTTNFTTAGGALTASQGLNALRMTAGTLDLAGFTLTNNSGALLFTGASSITNGALMFSNTEAIVTLASAAPITVGIGSAITNGPVGVSGLTVSATTAGSVLLLSGANTYSNLVINSGKVNIGSDANLGLVPTAANA